MTSRWRSNATRYVRRLLAILGVSTLVVSGAVIVNASPASATDAYPCGPRWWHSGQQEWVQTCPDWAPNNQIPVYASDYGNYVVGYIYAPGADWYVCQVRGRTYTLRQYQNNWWAYTMADNGQWGFVSEVYFRGGANNEADARLANCI